MRIHGSNSEARNELSQKLTTLLNKVDSTLLSRQQKLHMFRLAVCPQLTWDLSINFFPVSWLKTTLQLIATKFLKKWCGLARSADTSCIFLLHENRGMELPCLVTLYKKLQVSKAARYTRSRDSMVRVIASQETRKETNQKRPSFRPYWTVIDVMQVNPGASTWQLSKQAKARVDDKDTAARLNHSTSLARQNQPLKDDSRAPHLWSTTTITSLPERVLSFALNSLTDTLPHNSNLHLWKKIPSTSCNLCGQQQTLIHVLNACPYALEKRRYNDRHNAILVDLIPASQHITADLPSHSHTFPQQIVCTDSRPDIVVWDQSSITIIELTVSFEFCFDSAVARKSNRYSELLDACREAGYTTTFLSIEVGSRGFIHTASFDCLYVQFPANRNK